MAFDPASAQQWKDAVSVIWTAPQVVVPLLLFFAGAGMWFGTRTAGAGKDGLREQINALKEQNEVLNQRRALAVDAENSVREGLQRVTAELSELESQIANTKEVVPVDTSKRLETHAGKIRTELRGAESANNALGKILTDWESIVQKSSRGEMLTDWEIEQERIKRPPPP